MTWPLTVQCEGDAGWGSGRGIAAETSWPWGRIEWVSRSLTWLFRVASASMPRCMQCAYRNNRLAGRPARAHACPAPQDVALWPCMARLSRTHWSTPFASLAYLILWSRSAYGTIPSTFGNNECELQTDKCYEVRSTNYEHISYLRLLQIDRFASINISSFYF